MRENLQPREVKPAPLPSDLLELLSHPNSSVRRVGIQHLISLLDGKHLGLARAAQDKLREIAAEDDSLTIRKTAGDTLLGHGFVLETSAPIETPKEKQREEKTALSNVEGKIEKPVVKPVFSPEPPKPTVEKKTIPNINLRLLGGIAGGVMLIALCIWGGASLLNMIPVAATEEATRTSQPVRTDTPSSPTQTSVPPTPELGIGSTMTGEDGMTLLYVPAGEFTMGSDDGGSDEQPIHTVTLDAFWIDQTEVTNEMYANCVADGDCREPSSTTYFSDSNYASHPVVYVSWNDAVTYCSWADRRLPTEAEWEKAARWNPPLPVGEGGGEGEALIYPWGDVDPKDTLLNYNQNVGDTTEVGSYPDGASPYGALDMAGNVWEWVADWYSETYYASSPDSNPLGPDSGQYRVLRGGSWDYVEDLVRSANRYWSLPTDSYDGFGFRCGAGSPSP